MEDTLRIGDSGAAVSTLQLLLCEAEFDVPQTGIYDETTAGQVLLFQQERGLPATGEADSRTRALLTLLSQNDPEELIFYGDADKNGMPTAKDALLIMGALLAPARKRDLSLYDANGDGRIDAKDALFLMKCLFGKEQLRPVRERNVSVTDAAPVSSETLREDLEAETPLRRALVSEALRYAYDPLNEPLRPFPRSLYLWGANLFTEEKELYCPAPKDIEFAALKKPSFFNEGRRELMLRALAGASSPLSASDCSGAVVGLWRKFGLCAPEFDANAAELMHMGRKIEASELRPGDLAGFPGHIGLYAGGGAIVEWVGGAFGCQLTRLFDRRCWSFTEHKLIPMKRQFETFTRPDCLL